MPTLDGSLSEGGVREPAPRRSHGEQPEAVGGTLTDRERSVLRLRFGLEDGRARTLEEVGKQLGMTRSQIRKIEAKALHELRSGRAMGFRDEYEGRPRVGTCRSSQSGMAGITECELDAGHGGLHQGHLWGNSAFDLSTWKIGGSWGCTPPFFTPHPWETAAADEREASDLLVRLDTGEMVRLLTPLPEGTYRCPRTACWQLQVLSETASCPSCARPLCSRCSRCGAPRPHVPTGELAYSPDRPPVRWHAPDVDSDAAPS
jgi:hypothetical protein